jgi:hypothetical protein
MRFSPLAAVAVAAAATLAVPAFAGQAEREAKKSEEPSVTAATKAVKAACGCAPTIKVSWDSYKVADDMLRISDAADSIKDGAAEVCADKEGKAAFCKGVKGMTIDIHYKKGGDYGNHGGKVSCGTDDSTYCSQIVDDFKKF